MLSTVAVGEVSIDVTRYFDRSGRSTGMTTTLGGTGAAMGYLSERLLSLLGLGKEVDGSELDMPVSFVGAIGNDAAGNEVMSAFGRLSPTIDRTRILRSAGSTSVCNIEEHKGGSSKADFVTGSCQPLTPWQAYEAVRDADPDVLFLTHGISAITTKGALAGASERTTVILNGRGDVRTAPLQDVRTPLTFEQLSRHMIEGRQLDAHPNDDSVNAEFAGLDVYDRVDVFILTELEVAVRAGIGLAADHRLEDPVDAVGRMRAKHPNLGVVVVTRGDLPAVMTIPGVEGAIEIPVFDVGEVKRRTSLGDAFCAAFGSYLQLSTSSTWKPRDGFSSPHGQHVARNAAVFGSAVASTLARVGDPTVVSKFSWDEARLIAAKQHIVLPMPPGARLRRGHQHFGAIAGDHYSRVPRSASLTERQLAVLRAPEWLSSDPQQQMDQITALQYWASGNLAARLPSEGARRSLDRLLQAEARTDRDVEKVMAAEPTGPLGHGR